MRAVRIWLWTGVSMVLIQVMLGGITRLTESGLSIVEWDVVMGSFPPTSQDAWQSEFDKYQQTAQFEKVNTDFTVQDFKRIYWWEFIHRLWARLIGFVFLFPFLYFWWKKQFDHTWMRRLLLVFILGGLQGFVGWIMVASGLDGDPWVDPSKLTIHLLLALTVYLYLIWLALSWKDNAVRVGDASTYRWMRWIVPLIFVQIGLGGLMAGTDAGRVYTTWPLMNGRLAPEGMLAEIGAADKLVEMVPAINFVHRTFALVVALVIVIFWLIHRTRATAALQQWRATLVLLVILQCVLGILTLMHAAAQIPVFLGVAHQITACLLLGVGMIVWYQSAGSAREPG